MVPLLDPGTRGQKGAGWRGAHGRWVLNGRALSNGRWMVVSGRRLGRSPTAAADQPVLCREVRGDRSASLGRGAFGTTLGAREARRDMGVAAEDLGSLMGQVSTAQGRWTGSLRSRPKAWRYSPRPALPHPCAPAHDQRPGLRWWEEVIVMRCPNRPLTLPPPTSPPAASALALALAQALLRHPLRIATSALARALVTPNGADPGPGPCENGGERACETTNTVGYHVAGAMQRGLLVHGPSPMGSGVTLTSGKATPTRGGGVDGGTLETGDRPGTPRPGRSLAVARAAAPATALNPRPCGHPPLPPHARTALCSSSMACPLRWSSIPCGCGRCSRSSRSVALHCPAGATHTP